MECTVKGFQPVSISPKENNMKIFSSILYYLFAARKKKEKWEKILKDTVNRVREGSYGHRQKFLDLYTVYCFYRPWASIFQPFFEMDDCWSVGLSFFDYQREGEYFSTIFQRGGRIFFNLILAFWQIWKKNSGTNQFEKTFS